MTLAKGVLGSVIGGAVGAAIWIGASYLTAQAPGILTAVICIVVAAFAGGFSGMGMGLGTGGRGGRDAGVVAAVVALFAVLGGRYTALHLLDPDVGGHKVTLDEARSSLADEVYAEFETAGTTMTEPKDEDSYPPQVERETERRWQRMGGHEQEQYRLGVQRKSDESNGRTAGLGNVLGFLLNFGLFGIVCMVLAMSTAYKTGSRVIEKSGGEAMVNSLGARRDDDDLPAGHAYFNRLGGGEGEQQQQPQQPQQAPAIARPTPPARRPAAAPAPDPEEMPAGYSFFNSLGRGHNEQGDPDPAPLPGTASPTRPANGLRDAA